MENSQNKISINQTVAILIDGNNIEISVHNKFGEIFKVDYGKLIPYILKNRQLNKLYYFKEGSYISPKLSKYFKTNFFGVTTPCFKSADAYLIITAVQLAEKVDTIILLSGDVDFIDLVRYLKRRAVRVEVVGIKETMSEQLRQEADDYYEITLKDLRPNRGLTQ